MPLPSSPHLPSTHAPAVSPPLFPAPFDAMYTTVDSRISRESHPEHTQPTPLQPPPPRYVVGFGGIVVFRSEAELRVPHRFHDERHCLSLSRANRTSARAGHSPLLDGDGKVRQSAGEVLAADRLGRPAPDSASSSPPASCSTSSSCRKLCR